jgi:hypothetical protein
VEIRSPVTSFLDAPSWSRAPVRDAAPTPATLLLVAINAARHDPTSVGRKIGMDFSIYHARPYLIQSPLLSQAAQAHALDMASLGYFSHTSRNGKSPGDRVALQGYHYAPGGWAESIAAGMESPEATVASLLTDRGLNPPGHRLMLLGAPPYDSLIDVGVGYARGGPYGHYWVIDVARPASTPLPPAPRPKPTWWPKWLPWPF